MTWGRHMLRLGRRHILRHAWIAVHYQAMRPVWKRLARYDVYREKPNPWHHGGRKGKKREIVREFRRPSGFAEFIALYEDGWKMCRTR